VRKDRKGRERGKVIEEGKGEGEKRRGGKERDHRTEYVKDKCWKSTGLNKNTSAKAKSCCIHENPLLCSIEHVERCKLEICCCTYIHREKRRERKQVEHRGGGKEKIPPLPSAIACPFGT
jgi:hypothetical protein